MKPKNPITRQEVAKIVAAIKVRTNEMQQIPLVILHLCQLGVKA